MTVNQLRDPAIYQENGQTFLLYSTASEGGIAIAEMDFEGRANDYLALRSPPGSD